MSKSLARVLALCSTISLAAVLTKPGFSAEPSPPAGFRALFDGQTLRGWYGNNPHQTTKHTEHARDASIAIQQEKFKAHWRAEDGEFVNDGHGPYATTAEQFGDFEFLMEYKTVAEADSGIYLRGNPQVQIWA